MPKSGDHAQKEKEKKAKKQDAAIQKLMKENLTNVNALIGDQLQSLRDANAELLKLSETQDQKEAEQQQLNEKDIAIVEQLDLLAAQGLNTEEGRREYEKKQKEHETQMREVLRLSREREQLRKQISEARKKTIDATYVEHATKGGVEKVKRDFSPFANTFHAVQEYLERQGQEDQKNYDRIGAARSDTFREEEQENTRAFIQEMVNKWWDAKPRKAEPVAVTEMKDSNDQPRSPEGLRQAHQRFLDTTVNFEKQYQRALGVYEQLINHSFTNEDCQDQAKVASQNRLLSEGCAAIRELKAVNPEALNRQMEKAAAVGKGA